MEFFIENELYNDHKKEYAKISDGYGIMGILRISKGASPLSSYELSEESFLILVTGVLSVGQLYNNDIYRVTNTEFIPLRTFGVAENVDPRIPDLQRLISSGIFYFASADHDLTVCSQKRLSGDDNDHRFFWFAFSC